MEESGNILGQSVISNFLMKPVHPHDFAGQVQRRFAQAQLAIEGSIGIHLQMPMMFAVKPIGVIHSTLISPNECPKQAYEGAPGARLDFSEEYVPGLADLRIGQTVTILTWLHQADRAVLTCHPKDDPMRPMTGVFSTRSQDRPNPIGLHDAVVTAIDLPRIEVDRLEVIDGTPIIDLKPSLAN